MSVCGRIDRARAGRHPQCVAERGALRAVPVRVEVVEGPVLQLRPVRERVELAVGETALLDLVAVLADLVHGGVAGGRREVPVRAGARWTVEGDAVTVDESGRVTGSRVGTATASAVWEGVVSSPVAIAVRAPEPPRRVEIVTRALRVPLAGTRRLAVVATLPDGRQVRPPEVGWEISDERVVGADPRGFLHPVQPGSAEVRAVWLGVRSAPVTVEVVDLVGVTIAPAAHQLPVGARVWLTATGVHADGTAEPLPAGRPACSASAGDVVRLGDRGVLLAVRAGRATVSCSVGEVLARPLDVEVIDSPVAALVLDRERVDGVPGDRVPVAVTAVLADGTRLADPVGGLVRWTSSRPDVADAGPRGEVAVLGEGSAVLHADWEGARSDALLVRALPRDVTGLRVVAPAVARVGVPLRLVAEGVRASGPPHVVTDRVTWETDDPEALSFGDDGTATARAAGTFRITATVGSLRGSAAEVRFTDRAVTRLRVEPPGALRAGEVWVPIVEATFAGGLRARIGAEQVRWVTEGVGILVDRDGRVSLSPGAQGRVIAVVDGVRAPPVAVGAASE